MLWLDKNPFLLVIIIKIFVGKVAGSVQSDNSSLWRIDKCKNWKSLHWSSFNERAAMKSNWLRRLPVWYNSLIRYAYCNAEVSHSWKWPLKVNWMNTQYYLSNWAHSKAPKNDLHLKIWHFNLRCVALITCQGGRERFQVEELPSYVMDNSTQELLASHADDVRGLNNGVFFQEHNFY